MLIVPRRRLRPASALLATCALALPLALGASAVVAPAAAATATVTSRCLDSVPEPGSREPVKICVSVFKPAVASAKRRVPILLEGHGWAGSRRTQPADVKRWTDAGYGVISIDQRGFGQSGGVSHVMNPAFEGADLRRVVRYAASLPWVRKDAPGDPRMGAIGGSYGGGYQFLAAFELMRVRGKPVLDALAPQITWNDLNESLAPRSAVRTLWALVLSGAALASEALPPEIYKALVEGAATGTWPDGSIPGTEDLPAFFDRNGPSWHVRQGRRLGIPVLMGQGTTDSLFNLEQGLRNWRTALTPRARKRSVFIGYNGGHVLPAVLPAGQSATSDPCSKRLGGGSYDDLALRFFDRHLKGTGGAIPGRGKVHIGTTSGQCLTAATKLGRATKAYAVGTVATTTAAGPPIAVPIARGPIKLSGSAHLTATVTALGVDNRAFYGLGVGSSPLNARLVQNNMMPLRELQPVTGAKRRIELPAVGVSVPAGQTLYVIASAISDTSAGFGSRVPGVVLLEDVVAHLPVVR